MHCIAISQKIKHILLSETAHQLVEYSLRGDVRQKQLFT